MKSILIVLSFCTFQTDHQFSLTDGSILRGNLDSPYFNFMLKYGELKIDTKDIQKIEFGIHYPDGVEAKIDQSIENLSNSAFKQRENALNELIRFGKWSYFKVQKQVDLDKEDLEFKKRVKSIKDHLDNALTVKQKNAVALDKIFVGNSIFEGQIKDKLIKIKVKSLGDLNIHISDFELISKSVSSKSIRIDAAIDSWTDTDFIIDSLSPIKIEAIGNVDIWSQTPGQFTCGPNGHASTQGKNNAYKAGALLAKIGTVEYLVGDNMIIRPESVGSRLLLKINPSPWANASVGGYQVSISR